MKYIKNISLVWVVDTPYKGIGALAAIKLHSTLLIRMFDTPYME